MKQQKTWKKLRCILLNVSSQCEKPLYCIIPLIMHSDKGKIMDTVKRSVVVVAYGG